MELYCSLDALDDCDQTVMSKARKCDAESGIAMKAALERLDTNEVCRNWDSGKHCFDEFMEICPAYEPVYHLAQDVSHKTTLLFGWV